MSVGVRPLLSRWMMIETKLNSHVLFILVLSRRANAPAIFCAASDSSVVEVFGLGDPPFYCDVYCFFSWWHLWLDLSAVFDYSRTTVRWLTYDWLPLMIEMLDLFAQPHGSLTHIQISWTIAWYNNNLSSRDVPNRLSIIQLKYFNFRSVCFRFLTVCSSHVSLLSRCISEYLVLGSGWIGLLFKCIGGQCSRFS